MIQTDREWKEKLGGLPVQISTSPFFAPKKIFFALFVYIEYLILSKFLIVYKKDHLFLVLFFNFMYFFKPFTRKLILGFSIYIIYWIIFDYMKAFPNYAYNGVNISSLYNFEKQLFGIQQGSVIITPNEYFGFHHNSFLDLLSGIFYLCWIPVPLAYAGVLFYKNRRKFYEFSLTFLLANLVGFIGYYVYPAAPPWYVYYYGFDFVAHTPGNTAALGRFDQMVGLDIFKALYSKSSNVFAAMPSLHAAYMLIVVLFSLRSGFSKFTALFILITAGIWFSAIYSNHHYIVDVIAGIATALIAYFLFTGVLLKTKPVIKLVNRLVKITAS